MLLRRYQDFQPDLVLGKIKASRTKALNGPMEKAFAAIWSQSLDSHFDLETQEQKQTDMANKKSRSCLIPPILYEHLPSDSAEHGGQNCPF